MVISRKYVLEIRDGYRKGDFSAVTLDNKVGDHSIFLAKSEVRFNLKNDGEYTFFLNDMSCPGLMVFKPEKPIVDQEIADESSHYLLRMWAESQNFIIDDKTSHKDKRYDVPLGEIDFSKIPKK